MTAGHCGAARPGHHGALVPGTARPMRPPIPSRLDDPAQAAGDGSACAGRPSPAGPGRPAGPALPGFGPRRRAGTGGRARQHVSARRRDRRGPWPGQPQRLAQGRAGRAVRIRTAAGEGGQAGAATVATVDRPKQRRRPRLAPALPGRNANRRQNNRRIVPNREARYSTPNRDYFWKDATGVDSCQPTSKSFLGWSVDTSLPILAI